MIQENSKHQKDKPWDSPGGNESEIQIKHILTTINCIPEKSILGMQIHTRVSGQLQNSFVVAKRGPKKTRNFSN